VTVIGKLSEAVGVPLRTPAAKVIPIPVGNPVSENVMAPTPPVSENVTDGYAMPTVPAGNELGPTVIVGQFITRIRFSVPESPSESPAAMVIEYLPVCVGVPESSPLMNVIPEGRGPDSEMVTAPCPFGAVKVTGGE
jgi:hypothetical protein